MSKPFENNVAKWFHEQADGLDLQPGDRYAAELPDPGIAQSICEQILSESPSGSGSLTVEYEGEQEDIPTIEVDDNTMAVVLVRREGKEVGEEYEVSRSYATTLRNRIAEGQDDISDAALLMLYESGVLIETLDTTHTLFAAEGKLPLTDFQKRIQTNKEPLDNPGEAIVKAIERELNLPSDPLENLYPLRTYCRIYDACAKEKTDLLPGLLPEVGTYLTENEFGDGWFDKTESTDDLVDQAQQVLNKNAEHAERISEASQVTKDTESELEAFYTEDFIETVLSKADWTTITRSEAADGEIDYGSGDGSSSGGSTTTTGGTPTRPDRDPEFTNISVAQDEARIYGSGAEVRGDRSVIASVARGKFSATITYDIDVSDEPIALTDSTGTEQDEYTVDDDEITLSLSGLDDTVPHFYRLDVYVGHKTKRGTPENRFDFALVPSWFFDTLGDATFGVDVEKEALVVRNETSIDLIPPGESSGESIPSVEITDDISIELDAPRSLNPNSPPKTEQMRCKISSADKSPTPIYIDFLSEVEEPTSAEVQLPLSFAALMSPTDWADEDSLAVNPNIVTDITTGEFHSPSLGRLEIPSDDRKLLGFEQEIIEKGSIAARETEKVNIGLGTLNEDTLDGISADLIDAYTGLFNHFKERDTIPSTDSWDDSTQQKVEKVLTAYLNAIDSIDSNETELRFDTYRHLGTISSSEASSVWLTPFHPLMLAYALRVSRWRDNLEAKGLTDGFRFSRFRALFNPVGLNPYRWESSKGGQILSGHTVENNHLWASYSLVEGPQSDTPDYIEDVVYDKLRSFANAFPLLFRLHEERDININCLNMGDLGPFIQGLYKFFEFVIEDDELNLPQINLHIYGGRGEGRTLERFFAVDTADSPLREQLRSGKHDEIIEELDRRVTYIRAGSDFTAADRRPAHLTFFRGILDEQPGAVATEGFPSATRIDGLLPRDQIKIDSDRGKIVSRSGAAFDPTDDELLSRIGGAVNTLEASARDNEFRPGQTLSKVVKTSNTAGLEDIWEQSLWVLHVEPKVDLDFYIQSTAQASDISENTLMIHYSDQYDAASPGFDVITTTNKRDPYIRALQSVLNESSGLDKLDPESVLTRLVAIDGELALDIQKAEGTKTMELLGLVGGLAVSGELLASELPEYEWIPISLDEFARHDRKYKSDEEGLLQYIGGGKASDDLCFVGIPEEPDSDQLRLQMWLVETKGGTASVSKGVDQIKGAKEKIQDLFDPEDGFGDTEVLRSEFGEVILQIARRLSNYGVITDQRLETVEAVAESLADGAYKLDLLTDRENRIGEVIRIQKTLAIPEMETKDRVRVLKLPTDVLSLINQPDIGSNEIHSDLNRKQFTFDLPEAPANTDLKHDTSEDDSSAHTTQPSDPTEPDAVDDSDHENTETEDDTDTTDATEGAASDIESITDEPLTEGNESDDEDAATESAADGSNSQTEATEIDQATTADSGTDTESADMVVSTGEETDTDSDDDGRDEESESDQSADGSVDGYNWSSGRIEDLVLSLEKSPEDQVSFDISKLTANLKEQFESLGIDVYEPNPSDVSIGPRKIGINIRPKSGQKVEGILSSLNSLSVHIQASGTITGVSNPSEGAVRLEIPHGEPRDIYIREGFESNEETLREPLHIPLGVTTENEHIMLDLLEEHHALIGGSTGSGKSNFLASVICSLAVNYSPDTVQLSLLDPKGIDFGRFEEFPQVDSYIDDAEDCVEYLQSILESELQDRKDLLQEKGASSVEEYNSLAADMGFDPIPYRVIVIDEFADLIMSLPGNKDDFEDAVGRLAQIGRALGYSILLATQRPDADIVSGKIKTNFNCRISFELPSNTDSRVILDQPGAEDLEGAGDMIALTSGGEEYHLQSYLLLPQDAVKIRDKIC